MVKYLKEMGWETDVISVKDIVYHSYDESLLQEDQAVAVYRTGSADVMSLFKKASNKSGINAAKIYFRTPEFLKRIVRSSFLIDDKYGWLKFALKQADVLCSEKSYDAVMATIGPYTSALAAYKIHKKYQLPLIIDYRDHWTLNPFINYLTPLHRKISRWWEKRILEQSSLISTIGKKLAEELQIEFGAHLAGKFQVMYNGWDHNDFAADTEKNPVSERFTITYTGGLYGKRSALYFLRALEELKEEQKLPKDLLVRFVGNYYREESAFMSSEKLRDIVELIPQVDHWKAIGYMFQSDLLLMFSPSDTLKSGVTGKIFEYLRTGRNIFGMVPADSESAEILREHGQELICPMEDVTRIKELLQEIFQNERSKPGKVIPEGYSRREQVQKFSKRLGEIL